MKKVWKIGNKPNLYKLDNVSENIPKVGEEEMFGRGRFMLPFISLFTFWLIYLAYASVFLFCFIWLFCYFVSVQVFGSFSSFIFVFDLSVIFRQLKNFELVAVPGYLFINSINRLIMFIAWVLFWSTHRKILK